MNCLYCGAEMQCPSCHSATASWADRDTVQNVDWRARYRRESECLALVTIERDNARAGLELTTKLLEMERESLQRQFREMDSMYSEECPRKSWESLYRKASGERLALTRERDNLARQRDGLMAMLAETSALLDAERVKVK